MILSFFIFSVDPPRIELGTRPCDGRGIPFTYRPLPQLYLPPRLFLQLLQILSGSCAYGYHLFFGFP